MPEHKHSQGHGVGWISALVGLFCFVLGVCGVAESWWFGRHAKRTTAIVVEIDHRGEKPCDILGFIVAGQPYRVEARGTFGLLWGPGRGMKARVPILYVPTDPSDARLADFSARFAMPLFLLLLGCAFAPAGWLILRHSTRQSEEELEEPREKV